MPYKIKLNPTHEQSELLLTWVRGQVLEYYFSVQPNESANFVRAHADRIYNTVYGYLRGTKELDGSCSDLECTLGLSAFTTFKDVFRQEE